MIVDTVESMIAKAKKGICTVSECIQNTENNMTVIVTMTKLLYLQVLP